MKSTNLMLLYLAAVMTVYLAASLAGQAKEQAKKGKVALPAAVSKAIKDNVPNAEIDKVELETEAGIKLYDIEFKNGKGEIEIAADGTVMDIATIVQLTEIPKAAADAIQKAAAGAGAKIKQLERSEVRAAIKTEGKKGEIVKHPVSKYVYEAELVKGGQTGEIQVAPDGKVVEALKWVSEANEPEKKD